MKVPEDFEITEKSHTRAFFWLKVTTSTFTFETLLKDSLLNGCLNMPKIITGGHL